MKVRVFRRAQAKKGGRWRGERGREKKVARRPIKAGVPF